jgi:hypothetical protein
MENITITNTRLEVEEIIVFVSFNVGEKLLEDTFRFPLNISVPEMLAAAQERYQFYLDREVRIKEIYEEAREELINEE